MADRYIPHEEQCPVCGTIVGCEDKYCRKPSNALCGFEVCQAVWDAGTIHLAASASGRLPCCGLHITDTGRGDRMVVDPKKVTCKGLTSAAAAPSSVAE